MSTQKGNISRTRPQKYRNKTKFKNDLHDTSHASRNINKLEIYNVCSRCKSILEWKIKYKKYKPLKNPSTCVSCHMKNVKHSYHTMCTVCAMEQKVCPKCGKEEELVKCESKATPEELMKSPTIKRLIQDLSERKKRLLYRIITRSGENTSFSEEGLITQIKSLQLNSEEKHAESSSEDLSDFDF